MDGRIAANRAAAAEAGQEIAETRLQIADLGATARAEASTELQHIAERTAELEALIRSEEDVLARADIRAPEGGVISNLRVHTIGGVIAAGEPILDLVPSGEDLVVSARLRPVDVEGLCPGLPARVTLVAYSARAIPDAERHAAHHLGRPDRGRADRRVLLSRPGRDRRDRAGGAWTGCSCSRACPWTS